MTYDGTEPQTADHLFVDCNGYSHHGIYIGRGRVIHFDSSPARKLIGPVKGEPPEITECTIDEFSGGKPIHFRRYQDSLSPSEVIKRAKQRVGEKGYHLCDNNCEHFAVWCKTGLAFSTQVDSAQKVARTGMAGIALSTAVFRSARLLPLPYRVAAYTAGAALALGSTAYRLIHEKRVNRENRVS